MKPRARARLLWVLAGTTAAYGLVNVIVFYATGTFNLAWFTASLLVYGALLAAALYLSLVDAGEASAAAAEPGAAPIAATAAVAARRDLIYATGQTRVERIAYVDGGTVAYDYVVSSPRAVLSMAEIEARIDAAHRRPAPRAPEHAVEVALADHEAASEPDRRSRIEVTP